MHTENFESSVAMRPLVNGTTLQKYNGRNVTLIGVVILVNNQGTSFDVKTPDLQIVTVSLRKPLREPITGVVEVHGTVQGKNNILCDDYLVFGKELADSYDADILNDTVQIIQHTPTAWTDN